MRAVAFCMGMKKEAKVRLSCSFSVHKAWFSNRYFPTLVSSNRVQAGPGNDRVGGRAGSRKGGLGDRQGLGKVPRCAGSRVS